MYRVRRYKEYKATVIHKPKLCNSWFRMQGISQGQYNTTSLTYREMDYRRGDGFDGTVHDGRCVGIGLFRPLSRM